MAEKLIPLTIHLEKKLNMTKGFLLFLFTLVFLMSACGSDDPIDSVSNCDDPAYLSEKPEQYAPGFIVYLTGENDLLSELERLNNLYDIQVIETYEELNGFYADMSDSTMELIRCEDSVDSVYYNELHSTN